MRCVYSFFFFFLLFRLCFYFTANAKQATKIPFVIKPLPARRRAVGPRGRISSSANLRREQIISILKRLYRWWWVRIKNIVVIRGMTVK